MNIKQLIKKNKWINNCYIKYKWSERKVTYGCENADKTFYVIRRAPSSIGLFSYVMTNLGHIKYAIDKGYIPVIDMQTYRNTYLEEEQIGKYNAWEFYFEQPCGYTMNDVLKSKNVILSDGGCPKEYPGIDLIEDAKRYEMWHQISRKYLRVLPEIEKEAEEIYVDLFHEKRVLGVLGRGTDYSKMRPKNHPIQPNVDDIIKQTREIYEKKKCEYIYLATEDEDIYERFQTEFGTKLKTSCAPRYRMNDKQYLNETIFDKKNSRKDKGREYLINILLLARCNCLVAGSSGGTYGALLLTKAYEFKFVFEMGLY